MASEYWLCVQIPVPPCAAQSEKDKWRRVRYFFRAVELSAPGRHQPPERNGDSLELMVLLQNVREVIMDIKTLGLPLAAAALLMLAGCSTPTVVTLQNGTQYLTKDMPETKTKDGFFEFEDISGAKVKVKADEVATIRRED
jgi:hypothetical protein